MRVGWRAAMLALVLVFVGGAASALPPRGAAQTGGEPQYGEWLQGYLGRQLAALQAVPTALDLGNANWRRDQALALDAWGQLTQEARAQRPPPSAVALHGQLLQALEPVESARRLLLVAMVTGQDPGGELAAHLRAGQAALDAVAAQARAPADGRAAIVDQGQATRGNLRISVLGVQRPYTERGAPTDPGWEYMVVRLRLENLGGEPLRYDAYQFRLRMADDTLQPPTPLSVPDELLYGALEGNRLASQIVGNIAYAVRRGVPSVALIHERQPGDTGLPVPIADLLPLQNSLAAIGDALTPRPAVAGAATPIVGTTTGGSPASAPSAPPAP